MNQSPNKGLKLLAMLLMLSLMLTGCALLPTTITDTARSPVESGDTVTISREEYERLQQYAELEELRQKQKEAEFRQRDNRDPKTLRAALQSEITGILNGEIESEVFFKTLLDSLTVFKDRHMELRLNLLPQVFQFAG